MDELPALVNEMLSELNEQIGPSLDIGLLPPDERDVGHDLRIQLKICLRLQSDLNQPYCSLIGAAKSMMRLFVCC